MLQNFRGLSRASWDQRYFAEDFALSDLTTPYQGKLDFWWLYMAMINRDYHRKGVLRALVNLVRVKVSAPSLLPYLHFISKNIPGWERWAIPSYLHNEWWQGEFFYYWKHLLLRNSIQQNRVYTRLGFNYKGSTMMESPWGEWPIHVFRSDLKTAS